MDTALLYKIKPLSFMSTPALLLAVYLKATLCVFLYDYCLPLFPDCTVSGDVFTRGAQS